MPRSSETGAAISRFFGQVLIELPMSRFHNQRKNKN